MQAFKAFLRHVLGAPPSDAASQAEFCTTSRLLSCAVTEGLLPALYDDGKAVIRIGTTECIVQLSNRPILEGSSITLLDPGDMVGPLDLSLRTVWSLMSSVFELERELSEEILAELMSSVAWQRQSFLNPPTAPSWESESIDWEQSIVQGHLTHPMHKTRVFLKPMTEFKPGEVDLYDTHVRFVGVPREEVLVTGPFEEYISKLVNVTAGDLVVIPVHELQLVHIQHHFPHVHIFEDKIKARGQQSVRSVVLPGVDFGLKLALGVKLTSAVRTISPNSAFLGPRLTREVLPHLDVQVARELASVVSVHPDPEVAKHLACIVREDYKQTDKEKRIVCTALVEHGHAGVEEGVPSLVRVFNLHTEPQRLVWLGHYTKVFLQTFIPPILTHGLAFEAHPQNCIARFDAETKQLLGFIVRDFGGIKIHAETMEQAMPDGWSVSSIVNPTHSVLVPSMEDVYTRFYHTVVHNHLQGLVRALLPQAQPRAWTVVQDVWEQVIRGYQNSARAEALRTMWAHPTIPGKCFLRMRMVGMYRHHLHAPFPNLLVRGPESLEE